MTRISGQTFLITGANGGFGREMIRQLLQLDGHLVVTDVDGPALDDTARAIAASIPRGKLITCIEADLSDDNDIVRLHQKVEALGAPVDVLVNNAGVAMSGLAHEVPAEAWANLIQINLLAPMRLCQLFIPRMVHRGQGHVVNVASIAGWVGGPGLSYYHASKFGLRGYGDAIHAELAQRGVRVTTVYPFFSRTPILDSPRYGSLPRIPLPDKILTDPADVVAAIIKGIQQEKKHVFPDRTAHLLHWLSRLAPWALPYLLGRNLKESSSRMNEPVGTSAPFGPDR